MSDKIIHDSEVPAQGQQVITVAAFIHHTFDGVEKVFMPRRAATKKFLPNIYELPGGHVDFGEDIVDGLRREVQEELGMAITVGDPFAVFTYMNEIKQSHSIEVIYFAQFKGDLATITLQMEDHSAYVWLAESELEKLIADGGKPDNDPEIAAIKKGFRLLE